MTERQLIFEGAVAAIVIGIFVWMWISLPIGMTP